MSKRVKLYTNPMWLRRQYIDLRKSKEQIAEEQGVSAVTIWRYLDKLGLVRERRVRG